MDLQTILSFILVGSLWGTTNAFMETGTKPKEESKPTTSSSLFSGLGNLFANWRFLLPFGLNQLASLLNNFVVAGNDLSIAVPSVNCITFIVTFVTQRLLKGESLVDMRFFAGCGLIMAGMYLCLN
ncbi:hypothetical protein FGO68_gene8350 [Halteria grandinella]|uniref:Transmembrane protein 234 n=1 Tax=Halteria grandinella TaxID=5974 RepID=A0A8J8NHP8_HALGN|nr:hypothetical protein FGO68_gene8350 [Halteria grandinella]